MEGWMNRRLLCLLAAVAVGTSACSDNQLSPDTASAPALAPLTPSYLVTLPTECASPTQAQRAIDQMVPQLFVIGGGRWITAVAYNITIQLARRNGNTRVVKNTVQAFINFTLQAYYAGNVTGGQTPATQAKVLKLIYLLYCSNGITPIPDLSGIFGPTTTTTVLITNTTPTTTVAAPQQEAAVKIDQGDVPTSVFGTFVSVVRTSNPLPTSLDWYGLDGYKQGAFEFVANPAVTFTSPVTTGVCVTYDPDLVPGLASDLRLAHQVEPGYVPVVPGNTVVTTQGGTIEIGAPVSTTALGLDCSTVTVGSTNLFGRMMQQFARLVLPPDLLASGTKGGTGSQVVKFSPFAAVDTRLALSSSGPSGSITAPTAPVSVTVKTRHPIDEVLGGQTPISGITVNFAPGGSFSPSIATTNVDGTASSTWTLVPGLNTATGTPSEAPLTFDPAQANFSVNAVPSASFGWRATGWGYLLLGPYPGALPISSGTLSTVLNSPASYSGPAQAAFTLSNLDTGCGYNTTSSTGAFALNTVMAFRRDFSMPGNATSGTINFAVDNDFRVFVNGVERTADVNRVSGSTGIYSSGILAGFINHDGCAGRGDFNLSLTGLSPVTNTVAIIALDRGGVTYFDASNGGE
jgi:hypothetical protein